MNPRGSGTRVNVCKIHFIEECEQGIAKIVGNVNNDLGRMRVNSAYQQILQEIANFAEKNVLHAMIMT